MKQKITIRDGFYFGLGLALASVLVGLATNLVAYAVFSTIAAFHK